jgi:beta-lactamase class A
MAVLFFGIINITCNRIVSMHYSLNRREFLLAAAAIPFATGCTAWGAGRSEGPPALAQFAQLERELNGRLGVFAANTADGAHLGYRAKERFPVCSTFKVLLVSAILERSMRNVGLMEQKIAYAQSDLVRYSPITEKHLEAGMTVEALCAAGLEFSDNTAANLLMRILGGPSAVTTYARSIGDREFRLDRWETELNSASPGDNRDTSTPESMGRSLQRLVLEGALGDHQKEQLRDWLRGNTTGATRIRAGVPTDWQVGDKTGSGSYGTANDIAVLWPPQRAPLVVAVYTTQHKKDATARNDVVAAAARIVIDWAG